MLLISLLVGFIISIESLALTTVHDVIIVGAGMAGMRASQILSQLGIKHIILESTDHIGGRISPIKFAGIEVDKGASYVHDAKNKLNYVGRMVSALGWPVANATCSYRVMYYQNMKDKSLAWS